MNQYITLLEQKGIFNERLALVRLLLAISALLTIIFNDVKYITDFSLMVPDEATFATIVFFKKFSIFSLFSPILAKFFSILILVSVIIGYLPQLTCFFQAWIHLSICNSFLGVDGGDQIASNLSLLLIPICLFDNRLNQWKSQTKNETNIRKAINVFFSCYFFLIILQVAVIYLHSAVGKLNSTEWKDGTCAYYWFTNNVFGAPIYMQKFYNFITLSYFAPIITWSVIILELLLFACVLVTDKKIKKSFLIFGILFHFSIAITHGLITFFFSMAASLILYLDSENITYQYIKRKLKPLRYEKQ
ncbi:hypothetical protein [Flavobacterium sp. HJJ]|uniref:hypothetical protein n=1 Tax=Flavobacterium sp. HJJ TaxID=2783792 RepID=UPI00188CA6FB|nr:hypothetical protein [Flavobacterium sp. HJJ]MBF4472903.1 hypothetical protein [Flavobacterium sp. HJJ]